MFLLSGCGRKDSTEDTLKEKKVVIQNQVPLAVFSYIKPECYMQLLINI